MSTPVFFVALVAVPALVTREGVLQRNDQMPQLWKDKLEASWSDESVLGLHQAWSRIWSSGLRFTGQTKERPSIGSPTETPRIGKQRRGDSRSTLLESRAFTLYKEKGPVIVLRHG